MLIPYNNKKRKELKLLSQYPALAILDKFTGQGIQGRLQLLKDNDIRVVIVPANCTDRLQPLDISVYKPENTFLWEKFHKWYAEKVCQHIREETAVTPVDLLLSIVKPPGAHSEHIQLYYMKSKPEIVHNGFKTVGIVDCITTI